VSTPTALTFLGGAGTVTGSRFLLDHGDGRVLVDCGLFQGLRELRRRNWEQFPVDPASIDAVVVTHAHLDHSGYLPALARDGFAGRVVCTPDTAALAAIVLRDSARLQEEDAAYAAKGGFSKHSPPLPLYTTEDAEHVLSLFTPADFGDVVDLAAEMTVVLRPAGHVLGSSTAEVRVAGRTALFTGDLGRSVHPLLRPPAPPPAADVVVTESTYGNRAHPPPDVDTFAGVLRRTLRRGGVVLIPSFAVDRTEIVLHTLRLLMSSGTVPEVPVFLDSPMALETLAIYRRALVDRHADVRPEAADDRDFFNTGDLRMARTSAESAQLNQPGFPCVIVSASGMATGGRVVHHLKQLLPDKKNSVVLAGYQAVGTRGRDLVDGARQVKIHGKYVPVHAEIVNLLQFSVHADASEILDWLAKVSPSPETCYVVHGEPDASSDLRDRIAAELDWVCVVPAYLERVRLN
jgi:metallo-beta-lactamase family protein